MVLPDGEEPVAARVATISRKVQQALQPGKTAGNMLAGDALQVEIATLGAMNVMGIGNGHDPSEEARFAGTTTPRPKT